MENKRTIAVTGASGYIASWVVKKLLNHGHTVHATVRDLSNKEKTTHLLKQGEIHPGKLKMFEADLLEGGFKEAFLGCDSVIHIASPFLIGKVNDPQRELVDPALEGTRRVLEAVNAIETITKVVLTSSVVAMYNDAKEAQKLPEKTFTSDCWNTTASLTNQPYNYAKTVAEKEAWKMCTEQSRWTLTTIHPAFVMGPSLTTRVDGASMQFMVDTMRGQMKMGAPALSYGFVDVRDVAESHVHALEVDYTGERFISANEVMDLLEFGELVQRVTEHTEYPLPKKHLSSWLFYIAGPLRGFSMKFIRQNLGYRFSFDNRPIQEKLGVRFRSMDETFRDMVLQMERDNLI
ncbi:MAG: NAD-dependent epimerase/dehydratase family protein [Flavobacteriia bacterium]|nr:NAD-dependent epimerase/dehydratase family protein [Flavobacteriia bacterium]